MAGKGDSPRPADRAKFDEGYARIYGTPGGKSFLLRRCKSISTNRLSSDYPSRPWLVLTVALAMALGAYMFMLQRTQAAALTVFESVSRVDMIPGIRYDTLLAVGSALIHPDGSVEILNEED